MSVPSVNDMYIAAQWLEIYEGAEDAEACLRVSKWLKQQADNKELRAAAREHHVPVSLLRARLEASK